MLTVIALFLLILSMGGYIADTRGDSQPAALICFDAMAATVAALLSYRPLMRCAFGYLAWRQAVPGLLTAGIVAAAFVLIGSRRLFFTARLMCGFLWYGSVLAALTVLGGLLHLAGCVIRGVLWLAGDRSPRRDRGELRCRRIL